MLFTSWLISLPSKSALLVEVVGVVSILSYYTFIWAKYGRDPKQRTIIPLYNPPDNLSAAAMRYISRMRYDMRTFAASLAAMTVKRFITISEEDGVYTIEQGESDESVLATEELAIASRLLVFRNRIDITGYNQYSLKNAMESSEIALQMQYDGAYFRTNRRQIVWGALLSVMLISIAMLLDGTLRQFAYLVVAVVTACLIVLAVILGYAAFKLLVIYYDKSKPDDERPARERDIPVICLILALLGLLVVAGGVIGVQYLVSQFSPAFVITVVAIALINGLFSCLIKTSTYVGRGLLDKVEGFKMYLRTAEEDSLNTPSAEGIIRDSSVNTHFAYATALDIERRWSQPFIDALSQAIAGHVDASIEVDVLHSMTNHEDASLNASSFGMDEPSSSLEWSMTSQEMIERFRHIEPLPGNPCSQVEAVLLDDTITFRMGSRYARKDAPFRILATVALAAGGILVSYTSSASPMLKWVLISGIILLAVGVIGAMIEQWVRPPVFCRIDTKKMEICYSGARLPIADILYFYSSKGTIRALTRGSDEHVIIAPTNTPLDVKLSERLLTVMGYICRKPAELWYYQIRH